MFPQYAVFVLSFLHHMKHTVLKQIICTGNLHPRHYDSTFLQEGQLPPVLIKHIWMQGDTSKGDTITSTITFVTKLSLRSCFLPVCLHRCNRMCKSPLNNERETVTKCLKGKNCPVQSNLKELQAPRFPVVVSR